MVTTMSIDKTLTSWHQALVNATGIKPIHLAKFCILTFMVCAVNSDIGMLTLASKIASALCVIAMVVMSTNEWFFKLGTHHKGAAVLRLVNVTIALLLLIRVAVTPRPDGLALIGYVLSIVVFSYLSTCHNPPPKPPKTRHAPA
jgi:hypothetical protein